MSRTATTPALLFVPLSPSTELRFRVLTPDHHPVASTVEGALAAATALAVARHHPARYALMWKLRVGVESYYLAQVASGLDEYYTGAGEASGRWAGGGGSGAARPRRRGRRRRPAGRARRARAGHRLTPNGTRHESPSPGPGFDLTFSVPKSVSVVWALGDPLVQAEVVARLRGRAAESMAWLEREACFVRRGTNNRQARCRPGGVRHPSDDRRGVRRGAVPASHVTDGRSAPALACPGREHGPRDRRTMDRTRRHALYARRSVRSGCCSRLRCAES
jgi:hypothetical protein